MDTIRTYPFVFAERLSSFGGYFVYKGTFRFSFVERFVIFQSVGSTECASVQWSLTLLGQVVITY